MAQPTYELTVCTCCALVIANGDDSGCRDYYEHDHEECNLGLEQNESAHVESTNGEPPVRNFRCAGCGEDVVENAHTVTVLVNN